MTIGADGLRTHQNRKALKERARGVNPLRVRRHRESRHIDALIRLVPVRLIRLAELISRLATVTFVHRFGVKNTHLRILVMLGAHQPISVNELSRRTHIDKAWISRSLRGLVRRKLVTKAAHPADRRASLITLTKAGEALLQEIAPVALKHERQLLQELPSRDVERLLGILSRRAEEMLRLATKNRRQTSAPEAGRLLGRAQHERVTFTTGPAF